MAEQERPHLLQIGGLPAGLRERRVDVVVQEDQEAGLGAERQDAVERGVLQAGGVAGHLRRHELLVDAELADAGEDAGERLQDAADVIDAVHVGGLKPVIIGSKRACCPGESAR